MALMKRLACLAGKHERSRSKADLSGPLRRSVCRHCGTPMVKMGETWSTRVSDEPAPAPAAPGQ
jgi:hypothetical protein